MGCPTMRLEALDQVDLGLVSVFLGEEDEAALDLAGCDFVALSADAHLLAVGCGGKVLLLPQGASAQAAQARLLEPSAPGDRASCACWVFDTHGGVAPSAAALPSILLIGYESGSLAAYSSSAGELLWSARVHASSLTHLHASGGKELDVVGLFEGGVLLCIPSISALLHPERFGAGGSPLWLYDLPPESASAHVLACCGMLPALPLDLDLGGPAAHDKRLVLVMALPDALQLHTLRPPAPPPPPTARLADLIAARDGRRLLSRGLGALSSALYGGTSVGGSSAVASAAVPSPAAGGSSSSSSVPLAAHDLAAHDLAARLGATSCVRSLTDAPRGFASLALEPGRRRWLAATDTLGRVMLLEPKSLVCTRLFKGYRDAQCAWTAASPEAESGRAPLSKGRSVVESAASAPGAVDCAAASDGGSKAGRGNEGPLLVIYAPRRGILELWRVPLGGRVFACNVGGECALFNSGHHRLGPPCCFLVQQRTGVIFGLRRAAKPREGDEVNTPRPRSAAEADPDADHTAGVTTAPMAAAADEGSPESTDDDASFHEASAHPCEEDGAVDVSPATPPPVHPRMASSRESDSTSAHHDDPRTGTPPSPPAAPAVPTPPSVSSEPMEPSALHAACASGDAHATRGLLAQGANLDALDASGRTPLHLACLHGVHPKVGHVECVRLLLDAGAQVDVEDGDGDTPLCLAFANGAPGVFATMLRKAGADTAARGMLRRGFVAKATETDECGQCGSRNVTGHIGGARVKCLDCESYGPWTVHRLLSGERVTAR